MKVNKKKAIFLDRDGVINKKPPEDNYVKEWSEFIFLPNIAEAIKKLNRRFLVIIVSNQRGIARGMMSKEDVEIINEKMSKEIEKKNARIDGIYFCPHDIKDNCDCRKPKPGTLLKAAKDFKINLTESYMIGDSLSDIEAGKRAGCKTILISSSQRNISRHTSRRLKEEKVYPDFIVYDLLEATKIIEEISKKEL